MGDRRERKEPPKVDGMFTLKVDGISQYTNKEMLEEKFSPFGEVGDVYIPRKHGSSDNRGYAFVRFLVEADGLRAMDELNGQDIDGKPVTIAEAKQPRPENPRAAMREREGGRFRDRDFRDRDRDRDYRSDRDRGGYRDRDSRRDSRDRDYGRDRRDYGRDRSRDRDYAPPRRDYHDSYDAPRYDAPRSDYRSRSRSPRGRY